MRFHKDLSGTVINGITILQYDHKREYKTNTSYLYRCRCHCGKEWVVNPDGFFLKKNTVRSCGCSRKLIRGINKTHGMSGTSTYKAWTGMRDRCLNPKQANYADWGGRGIQICERWGSFENFLEDMGVKPAGTSLDRKDVNGHYCKDNCRWADATTQRVNQRPRLRNRDRFAGMDAEVALILAH